MTIITKIKVSMVINKIRKHHWEIIICHENEDANKHDILSMIDNFAIF